MKLGIEVEGKYKGFSTFFIQDTELPSFLSRLPSLLNKHTKTRHLYITDTGEIGNYIGSLVYLTDLLNITVETSAVVNLPKGVHIMLNIPSKEVWGLKETDSIKFHDDKNNVMSIPVESFLKTKPEDFDGDIEL